MPLIRGEEIIIPTINHNQFVNTIDYNTVINQPIINVIYNIVYPMINNNIFFISVVLKVASREVNSTKIKTSFNNTNVCIRMAKESHFFTHRFL